ncbi:hypothetical protein B5M19_04045, partial [Mesomycoplasma hyopneumoniae]|uniref:hypothetical protein n=1 Tax=Mesomycoplasma hyopneumoniae TaxID=2099 RepID=UPI000B6CB31E
TYYRSIENRKTTITISPNVLLHEDMQASPFILNKITTLFKYNKKDDDDETESLDNRYFYLEPNKISLKQANSDDIKNNIIRKPLFISNNFTPKLQPDNLYYFDGEYFFLN